MSIDNGHLPEGAVYATAELLRALHTRLVKLPDACAASGKEVFVRIRRINRVEYIYLWPPLPEVSRTWPPEEYEARRTRWLESLPLEELMKRRRLEMEVRYRVIEMALLEPALTVEQIRQLANDVDVIYTAILDLSDLSKKDEEPPQKKETKETGQSVPVGPAGP